MLEDVSRTRGNPVGWNRTDECHPGSRSWSGMLGQTSAIQGQAAGLAWEDIRVLSRVKPLGWHGKTDECHPGSSRWVDLEGQTSAIQGQ